MKLFLLDDFDDASEKVIESYLIAENVTFEKLDNFDNFDDFEKFDSVCVVASVEYNFVSKDMFKFVKHLIKKQFKANLQVMFIESFNQNAKIAIDWLFSLKDNYLFDVDVLGEFSRENLSEDLKLFLGSKQTKLDVTQKNNDNNVVIYTDGACSGNPGAGGWGAILMHGNHKKEISGFEPETTNNRMELTAVIVALSSLKAPCCVELYSDSAYVVNAIKQGWLENWKKNGWIGSDKKQVKNIELWKALDELMQKHTVNFNKVKGHADNPFNNRCDELATGEIAKNANNV